MRDKKTCETQVASKGPRGIRVPLGETSVRELGNAFSGTLARQMAARIAIKFSTVE